MTNITRSNTALGLTVAGAVLRLLPHPPNLAPVGAMSLFAGARLSGWQAYLVPLLLMVATDPILSARAGYEPFTYRTPVVYLSFMISVWIGRRLQNTGNAGRIAIGALACATQFYLITNFQSWLFDPMYTKDAAGLVTCYVSALPFFGYTLLGNFVYCGLLFGAYAWLTRRVRLA